MSLVSFLTLHFNFVLDMLTMCLSQILILVLGSILFDEPKFVETSLLNLASLLLFTVPLYLIMNHALLQHTELKLKVRKSRYLNQDQEEIMDDFGEGLLILDAKAE